jgi:hypothetical protein
MTLHLIKLCVGAESIEDLSDWQAKPAHRRTRAGKSYAFHTTFQTPKRLTELLDGGSLYWVIKGTILVRQPLADFDEGTKSDGSPCCVILLERALIPVRPVSRRAFQGWRYLSADDAPPDLKKGSRDDIAVMPAQLRKTLANLGLI